MKAQILWRWQLLYRFGFLGNVKNNEVKQGSYDLNKGSSTGKSLERFHTDSHPFLPHKMRTYLMNIAFGACFGDRFFDFWGTTIIQIGWSWKGFKNSSIENALVKKPPKHFYPSMFFHFHKDLCRDGWLKSQHIFSDRHFVLFVSHLLLTSSEMGPHPI